MKKNLAISIVMLILAVFTCVGVSFAYFSSSLGGSQNSVEIGKFVFTSESNIESLAKVDFKAPTIINVPQITKPSVNDADYDLKQLIYLEHGDDKYFNSYCAPFKVTTTNLSSTDMKIKISVSAVPGTDEALNANYGVNGGFQYFVFDDAYTKLLTESGGEQENKFAENIRNICSPENPFEDATKVFENTKLCIKNGNDKMTNSMHTDINNILLAASINGDGNATYKSKEFLVVMWLDWRGFKDALGQNRPFGTLDIKINVEASQYI